MKTRDLLLLLGLLLLVSGCKSLIQDDVGKDFFDKLLIIPTTSFPNISEGIKASSKSSYCIINHDKQKQNYAKYTAGKEKDPGYELIVYPFPVCEESESIGTVFQVPKEEAEAFDKWLQGEVQSMPNKTRVIISLKK